MIRVGHTGKALAAILERIVEHGGAVDGIAQNAKAQAAALGEVNLSVGSMDRMTQQNAAMAEECTATARSLSEQADVLADRVADIRLAEPTDRDRMRRAA